MTPDTGVLDRNPRPPRRTVVFGAAVVLAAGVAVAAVGFLAAPVPAPVSSQQAAGADTQNGQLTTYPLHDEKPMRMIGKGVPGSAVSSEPPTSTPAPAPAPTSTSTFGP